MDNSEQEKTAVISNVLSVPEKYVTKKILRDFTTNLVYYYGGGEDKLTDDIRDDYDGSLDLEVQGFRRNREKGTYEFYLGRMDLLKKHFGDFYLIDERSDVPMSDYAMKNLHLKDGFEFRPKQREVIEEWLKHKRGILKSPARFGKCVTGDTLVLTDNGLVRIDELCKECDGEDVTRPLSVNIVNYKGEYEQTSCAYRGFDSETIRVTTRNGNTVCGTEIHPLLTLRKGWTSLKDVAVGDLVLICYEEPSCGTPAKMTWDTVDRIESCGVQKVYDLMVPGSHSFVGNWIVMHNTICMGCIALKLKRKTLIIANQSELLNQWEKEFRSFVSNVADIESKKHPIIGHLKDFDRDVPKYDILLSSWQIWNVNRGKLHKYASAFGLVLCDEIHRCSAECPKDVLSQFKARYKGGVTATPERKDGREVYCEYIVGPVTAEGVVEQMKCIVVPTRTGLPPPMIKNNFTKLITRLCEHSERNLEIVDLAVDCANRGDYVVIGTDRVNHCELLAKLIEKRGVPAAAFHSKCNRKKVMADAKSGKVRVTVAMRSMLTGINIPRWNVYFNILPISNPPSYYQMFSRVRTVIDGKNNAYIYDFIDEEGVCWGAYRKRCDQYDSEGFTYAKQLKLRELERKDSDIEEADEEDRFRAKRKKAQVKRFYDITNDKAETGALFDD